MELSCPSTVVQHAVLLYEHSELKSDQQPVGFEQCKSVLHLVRVMVLLSAHITQ